MMIPILLIDLGESYGVLVPMVSLLLAMVGIALGALGSKGVDTSKDVPE